MVWDGRRAAERAQRKVKDAKEEERCRGYIAACMKRRLLHSSTRLLWLICHFSFFPFFFCGLRYLFYMCFLSIAQLRGEGEGCMLGCRTRTFSGHSWLCLRIHATRLGELVMSVLASLRMQAIARNKAMARSRWPGSVYLRG